VVIFEMAEVKDKTPYLRNPYIHHTRLWLSRISIIAERVCPFLSLLTNGIFLQTKKS